MKRRRCILAAALAVVPFPTSSAQSRQIASEAEAYVGRDSAYFIFPSSSVSRYFWDIPRQHNYKGFPEYTWGVAWDIDWTSMAGKVPMYLWLTHRWNAGGPHRGSLAELTKGNTLDPMIECMTCDGAVFVDQERDTAKVFATVQGGRLVFTIRGREAVQHIFPVVPSKVTFEITTNIGGNGTPSSDETQTVRVNCVAGTMRKSCIVPPEKSPPNADSTAAENAPRRIYVIVVRFANATLVPNVPVSIRTTFGKEWARMKTGVTTGFLMQQPPLGYLLLEAHCPGSSRAYPRIFGTAFVNVRAGVDSSVHIVGDPDICRR